MSLSYLCITRRSCWIDFHDMMSATWISNEKVACVYSLSSASSQHTLWFHGRMEFRESRHLLQYENGVVKVESSLQRIQCLCDKRVEYKTGWPSGLRRWIKAPISSGAWVRIPLQSSLFVYGFLYIVLYYSNIIRYTKNRIRKSLTEVGFEPTPPKRLEP